MRLFFSAHRNADPLVRVPEEGLLYDPVAFFYPLLLTSDFVGKGLFHVPEGIHILEFSPCPQYPGTLRAY